MQAFILDTLFSLVYLPSLSIIVSRHLIDVLFATLLLLYS